MPIDIPEYPAKTHNAAIAKETKATCTVQRH